MVVVPALPPLPPPTLADHDQQDQPVIRRRIRTSQRRRDGLIAYAKRNLGTTLCPLGTFVTNHNSMVCRRWSVGRTTFEQYT
jgi:hypothetical protein